MEYYLLPKLPRFLFGILLLASSCSKTIDKNPGSGDGGTGGVSDPDVSLTTPVAHKGDVPNNADPDPVPQASDVYAPFVGVWKQNYGDQAFAFLSDGRVAFYKSKNGHTEKYIGMYFKTNTPG